LRLIIDIATSGREVLTESSTRALWLRKSATTLIVSTVIGSLLSVAWLHPELFWISLLGHAALVATALRCSPKQAFLIGCTAGTTALAIAFHWSPASITETTNLVFPWPIVVFLLLVMWESVIFGMFALIISLLRNQRGWMLILGAAWWVTFEFHWPRVFTWAIAHTHTSVVPILQLAEFAGTSGVSAVLVLATIGLGALTSPNGIKRYSFVSLLALSIVVGNYFWGLQRIEQVREGLATQATIRVAAIQVDPTDVDSIERMRTLTRSLDAKVDVVLWPESSLGNYHYKLTDFRDPIRVSELSEAPNPAEDPALGLTVPLIAGGKTYDEGGRDVGPYRNTAFLIDPDKTILGRYVKRTLIPFGEYVPGESWFPSLQYWAALNSSLICGATDDPLVLRDGKKIGALICYEDMICSNARRTVAAGAECFAVIINGSAFRDADTLAQHLRLAQLRVVENRRSMIRCAATGITCKIAATGQVEQSIPSGIDGTLIAELPLSTELTFYTRYGDWFAWLCTFISIGLVFWLMRSRKQPDGMLVDSYSAEIH
jgi:apolipoprotein N-acyltransferase